MTLRRPRDIALQVGAGLVLSFDLPGTAATIRVSALVMSDTLAGSFRRTGVHFVALSAELEQRIMEFCRGSTEQALPAAIVA